LYDYLLKYINYFFIFNFNKSGKDTIALDTIEALQNVVDDIPSCSFSTESVLPGNYLKSKYLYDYLLKYINYFFIFNFNKSGIDIIALNIMICYKLITPATI